MPIVTLTSDLGIKDYYVAIIKGKIMTQVPAAQLVDITHEITPFNIQEAAFVLKNTFPHFPEGTIHLASVHAETRMDTKIVVVEHANQYFVGMDNGLFALMLDDLPHKIVEIPQILENPTTFIAKDKLCDVVVNLLNGKSFSSMGQALSSLETKTYLRPPENSFLIRATIVYIDRYGNLITSLSYKRFEKLRAGRSFIINYKRNEELREISTTYNDVPEGERLCLFNSSGNLEIAINKGNANQLLGLHLDHLIQIEFE
jgi:S-adenosyl-L-methionine hydrolase (adenosine-forming)